jgi:hypothetical protein
MNPVSNLVLDSLLPDGANIHDIDPLDRNMQEQQTKVVNALRDQLNFYMGDSNLQRDQFLRQKILKSRLVEIEVFLKCHKIG